MLLQRQIQSVLLQNNLCDLVALIFHNNSVNLSFYFLFQDDVTVYKSTSGETHTPCHLQECFQRFSAHFLDALRVSKGLHTITGIVMSFLYGNNSSQYHPTSGLMQILYFDLLRYQGTNSNRHRVAKFARFSFVFSFSPNKYFFNLHLLTLLLLFLSDQLGDTKTIRPFALKDHGSIAHSASSHGLLTRSYLFHNSFVKFYFLVELPLLNIACLDHYFQLVIFVTSFKRTPFVNYPNHFYS